MNKLKISNPIKIRISLPLVLITAVFSFACNSAPAPQPVSNATANNPAGNSTRPIANEKAISKALDVPLAKLDGATLKLADFKGKVMVVDFWGTFCPPCVKQAPQLAELSKRYRDQGLEVIGLTADKKSDQKLVEDFIKRVGINYTIAYANNWVSDAFLKGTQDETGTHPLPQLFVLSRDGRVVEHLIGDSPQHGVPYLEKVVKQELSVGSR
ncbi:MAG: TlpA family protein disulfide reductase [Acidobacteria bacterium]|nr:TlpA family protein disulfide reductase [Acidobacteriota bacterium]